jgi:hypothetical protein
VIRVYVAGPYSANNVMDVLHNIREGIDACARLLLLGFAPYCPWLDHHYVLSQAGPALKVADLQEASMQWLGASQALFLLPGWEQSKGTRSEWAEALDRGIPAFSSLDDLLAWREKQVLKNELTTTRIAEAVRAREEAP